MESINGTESTEHSDRLLELDSNQVLEESTECVFEEQVISDVLDSAIISKGLDSLAMSRNLTPPEMSEDIFKVLESQEVPKNVNPQEMSKDLLSSGIFDLLPSEVSKDFPSQNLKSSEDVNSSESKYLESAIDLPEVCSSEALQDVGTVKSSSDLFASTMITKSPESPSYSPIIMNSLESTKDIESLESHKDIELLDSHKDIELLESCNSVELQDSSKHSDLLESTMQVLMSPQSINNFMITEEIGIGKNEAPTSRCPFCMRDYSSVINLDRHMNRAHRINYVDLEGNEGLIKCGFDSECFVTFSKMVFYRQHLMTAHGLQIEKVTKQFKTIDEFMSWKASEEHTSQSQFKKLKKEIMLKYLKNGKKCSYVCHRSENVFTSSLSKERLTDTSCCCPAKMELVCNNEKIDLTYYKTHVGHDDDTKAIEAQLSLYECAKFQVRRKVLRFLDNVQENKYDAKCLSMLSEKFNIFLDLDPMNNSEVNVKEVFENSTQLFTDVGKPEDSIAHPEIENDMNLPEPEISNGLNEAEHSSMDVSESGDGYFVESSKLKDTITENLNKPEILKTAPTDSTTTINSSVSTAQTPSIQSSSNSINVPLLNGHDVVYITVEDLTAAEPGRPKCFQLVYSNDPANTTTLLNNNNASKSSKATGNLIEPPKLYVQRNGTFELLEDQNKKSKKSATKSLFGNHTKPTSVFSTRTPLQSAPHGTSSTSLINNNLQQQLYLLQDGSLGTILVPTTPLQTKSSNQLLNSSSSAQLQTSVNPAQQTSTTTNLPQQMYVLSDGSSTSIQSALSRFLPPAAKTNGNQNVFIISNSSLINQPQPTKEYRSTSSSAFESLMPALNYITSSSTLKNTSISDSLKSLISENRQLYLLSNGELVPVATFEKAQPLTSSIPLQQNGNPQFIIPPQSLSQPLQSFLKSNQVLSTFNNSTNENTVINNSMPETLKLVTDTIQNDSQSQSVKQDVHQQTIFQSTSTNFTPLQNNVPPDQVGGTTKLLLLDSTNTNTIGELTIKTPTSGQINEHTSLVFLDSGKKYTVHQPFQKPNTNATKPKKRRVGRPRNKVPPKYDHIPETQTLLLMDSSSIRKPSGVPSTVTLPSSVEPAVSGMQNAFFSVPGVSKTSPQLLSSCVTPGGNTVKMILLSTDPNKILSAAPGAKVRPGSINCAPLSVKTTDKKLRRSTRSSVKSAINKKKLTPSVTRSSTVNSTTRNHKLNVKKSTNKTKATATSSVTSKLNDDEDKKSIKSSLSQSKRRNSYDDNSDSDQISSSSSSTDSSSMSSSEEDNGVGLSISNVKSLALNNEPAPAAKKVPDQITAEPIETNIIDDDFSDLMCLSELVAAHERRQALNKASSSSSSIMTSTPSASPVKKLTESAPSPLSSTNMVTSATGAKPSISLISHNKNELISSKSSTNRNSNSFPLKTSLADILRSNIKSAFAVSKGVPSTSSVSASTFAKNSSSPESKSSTTIKPLIVYASKVDEPKSLAATKCADSMSERPNASIGVKRKIQDDTASSSRKRVGFDTRSTDDDSSDDSDFEPRTVDKLFAFKRSSVSAVERAISLRSSNIDRPLKSPQKLHTLDSVWHSYKNS